MTTSSKVLLLLGAGPNVGTHVSRAFAAKGYKIGLASRSAKTQPNSAEDSDALHLQVDLSRPETVASVFEQVKAKLGAPSVVVYNAGAATANPANDPLSLPLEAFTRDFAINTTSAFVAAQQAAIAFADLPASAAKTFIYTGNLLNTTIMAPLMDLGVGKSATAHVVQSAAAAYADRGYKFYYADERNKDGSAAFKDISGEAHGVHYVQLAEGKEQGPWQQTFVKDFGYQNFEH